jgi:hypothetical protein
MNAQDLVRRTVLYYPTIEVPTDRWLRQAILYWDDIGSIVPERYDNVTPSGKRYSPEVEMLRQNGLFRPFNPGRIMRQHAVVGAFKAELESLVDGDDFRFLLSRQGPPVLSEPLYQDKVNHEVFNLLEARGLVEEREKDGQFYYFESSTALLYMAVLAKYLADDDEHATVPGTDLPDYEQISFRAAGKKEGLPCVKTRLNVLPVPREDVPISAIMEYRQNHPDELNNFRKVIDEMQGELKKSERRSDVQDVLAKYASQITGGVNNLAGSLNAERIPTTTGTLKAIFKPDVVKGVVVAGAGILGIGGGVVAAILGAPVAAALAPIGVVGVVAGAIEVADFRAGRRNAERTKLRDSYYSYLYMAEQEKII